MTDQMPCGVSDGDDWDAHVERQNRDYEQANDLPSGSVDKFMEGIFGDSLNNTLEDIARMQNPIAGIPTALDMRTAVPDYEKSAIERGFKK